MTQTPKHCLEESVTVFSLPLFFFGFHVVKLVLCPTILLVGKLGAVMMAMTSKSANVGLIRS